MGNSGGKMKTVRFWTLKIFFITLFLSGTIGFVTEFFMGRIPFAVAVIIVFAIIMLGVIFDIIGVAFSTCDTKPFVAMASKRVREAKRALKLLKNASSVANFCNDVVGDICGIVSGAAGAAIVAKIVILNPNLEQMWLGIGVSALIAAMTVALKSMGKDYAIKNSRQIVQTISKFLCLFSRNK